MSLVPAVRDVVLAEPSSGLPSPMLIPDAEVVGQFCKYFKYLPRSDGCDHWMDVVQLEKDKDVKSKRIVGSALSNMFEQEEKSEESSTPYCQIIFDCLCRCFC
jgi:hypothetical protein